MRNVADVLPENQRLDPTLQQARTVSAYAALFGGNGSIEDAELVLVDLALYTRYYVTAPIDMPSDQVKALDQRRAVLNRILTAMTIGGARTDGLRAATFTAPLLPDEEITG
jgi:hypothetical protein